MQIFRSRNELQPPHGPWSIALGVFDGVHLGHRALLANALAMARQAGIGSLVYTFHPHPGQALAPDFAPKLIEPLHCRLDRLAALGFDAVLVEPFDRDFAAIEAEVFVRDILVEQLRAKHVTVGEGFGFGHRNQGRPALLAQLGALHGFAAHEIAQVNVDGLRVSSSKIREFVSSGLVHGVEKLLGRRYELCGKVVEGAARGRRIGFPTANVEPENELLPGIGVYAAQAHGPFGTLPAVVNVGLAPTFDVQKLKVEAHLLDYDGAELYGQPLRLAFVQKLRDERRFASADALVAQINSDIAAARALLRGMP